MKSKLLTALLILIITLPAFFSLITNTNWFSMHDDQHIARLYLLDTAIRQGTIFPRWVDGLGFGFGYPLFNFYPPLVYYIGEIFHLVGFSFIMSIKLVFVVGFLLAGYSSYLLGKKIFSQNAGIITSICYTYFFYHATTSYVRGSLAEFFTMSILPFVFLNVFLLASKTNIKNLLFLGVSFAAVLLCHPLIAFPSVFFIAFFYLFLIFNIENKKQFTLFFAFGIFLGLCLSAFFWIPSIIEKQYTLVDNILTKELYNYRQHFVYLQQLIYSPWGYGGSTPGPIDGMSFQIGKLYFGLLAVSVIYALFNFSLWFWFFIFLTIFGIFMTSEYSTFIWNQIQYLWYLQFPWRFFTFIGLFMSLAIGYGMNFFEKSSLKKYSWVIIVVIFLTVIYKNSSYFYPQKYLSNDDAKYTNSKEISDRVSRTSFEFMPKEVATKMTEIGSSTIDLPMGFYNRESYEATKSPNVKIIQNNFNYKEFETNSIREFKFQLNQTNFIGWKAYVNGIETNIEDKNKIKLINVTIPPGKNSIKFVFEDTPVRMIANYISILSLVFILYKFYRINK